MNDLGSIICLSVYQLVSAQIHLSSSWSDNCSNSVTSIITSRFILNLREGNSGSSHLESWSEFSDPGLAIPSGLGNLGRPLEHCIDIETASEFHLDWTIPSSPSLSSVVDFFKEVRLFLLLFFQSIDEQAQVP